MPVRIHAAQPLWDSRRRIPGERCVEGGAGENGTLACAGRQRHGGASSDARWTDSRAERNAGWRRLCEYANHGVFGEICLETVRSLLQGRHAVGVVAW